MTLGGLVFTRQFPNSAEPVRGTFVVQQIACTASEVDWSVIAPVPFAPRALSALEPRAAVQSFENRDGVSVWHPRYAVLPRRMLFTTVWRSMASASRQRFGRIVGERHPDFVHAHELYPSGRAALELAREHGLPLIVTVHGSDLYTNLEEPSWRELLSETLSGAEVVVCVSESLADDVSSAFGIDRPALRVISDTYDAGRFTLRERQRESADSIRLLSVGRLVDVKGFDVLLHALSRCATDEVSLELRIVGEGPLRQALEGLAQQLGVAERVSFAGALDAEELVEEMARADLYVQPSRKEGFGVAVVEALATGLPAVVTASGGPTEIVSDADGETCAPDEPVALADSIARAVQRLEGFDPGLIAERARQRFGPEHVGSQLTEVYRGLVQDATADLAGDA